MTVYKHTMIFRSVSNFATNLPGTRVGGWTESFYDTSLNNGVSGKFVQLQTLRAQMLPYGTDIIGQRYAQVTPKGGSSTAKRTFPGNPAYLSDIPQMALQCSQGTEAQNIARHIFRGVPDSQVTRGEYVPTAPYSTAVSNLGAALPQWRMLGRDLTQPIQDAVDITADGVITLAQAAVGIAVNDKIQLMRFHDLTGKLVSGIFKVTAVAGSSITIAKYTFEAAALGGQIRKSLYFYYLLSNTFEVDQIITRRVGRPLKVYRGRRSTR